MKHTLHDQAACCRVAVTALERIAKLLELKSDLNAEEQAIHTQASSTLKFLESFSSANPSQRPKQASMAIPNQTCDCAAEGMFKPKKPKIETIKIDMKKTIICILTLCGLALFTGCANFSKSSVAKHEIVRYGAIAPTGWTIVVPTQNITLPLSENFSFSDYLASTGTNEDFGFWAKGPKTFVASRESWIDKSSGGGTFLFTDPAASQVSSVVANQTALGGSHNFGVGSVSSTISSNAVAAISAGGTAVGNIIGAAASAAAGK